MSAHSVTSRSHARCHDPRQRASSLLSRHLPAQHAAMTCMHGLPANLAALTGTILTGLCSPARPSVTTHNGIARCLCAHTSTFCCAPAPHCPAVTPRDKKQRREKGHSPATILIFAPCDSHDVHGTHPALTNAAAARALLVRTATLLQPCLQGILPQRECGHAHDHPHAARWHLGTSLDHAASTCSCPVQQTARGIVAMRLF
jgi:hypothetical protein